MQKRFPERIIIQALLNTKKGAFIFDFVLYVADPRTLMPWNKPS